MMATQGLSEMENQVFNESQVAVSDVSDDSRGLKVRLGDIDIIREIWQR